VCACRSQMDLSGMRQGSMAGRCEPAIEYQTYAAVWNFLMTVFDALNAGSHFITLIMLVQT
jgi:hypothetical protein